MTYPGNSSGNPENQWNVSRVLTSSSSRISFNGSVCVPAMQATVQCAEEGFDYYQYESVEIEIDSPGGESKALNYLLERLDGWRSGGRTIATRAVVTCASAAALLLALGTIGKRRVNQTTELLFHFSRIVANQAAVTADSANRLAGRLDAVDRQMLDRLMIHIAPAEPDASFDAATRIAARFVWLEGYLRDHPAGADLPLHVPKADLARLRRIVETGTDGLRERLKKHLAERFRADRPLGLLEAYVLNLIDRVGDVTPVCEPADAPSATLPPESPRLKH